MPTEQQRVMEISERMLEIMGLSDTDCDRLEDEFKKANIMK